jgi:hypothetical protein
LVVVKDVILLYVRSTSKEDEMEVGFAMAIIIFCSIAKWSNLIIGEYFDGWGLFSSPEYSIDNIQTVLI